ncbi:hypothetical protein BIW11_09040, partial [Tropilaelaps mercedesae]
MLRKPNSLTEAHAKIYLDWREFQCRRPVALFFEDKLSPGIAHVGMATDGPANAGMRNSLSISALCVLCWFSASLLPGDAIAERNVYLNVSEFCGSDSNPIRQIEGAVLASNDEKNLYCVMTFQTSSILQKLALRFERLSLGCNDHVAIFFGDHAIGRSRMDVSCRHNVTAVGTLVSDTNFVTLKYTTDHYRQPNSGFILAMTAFTDAKHPCKQFKCWSPGKYCISTDLTCDGVNHCGDGSDEDESELCPESRWSQFIFISARSVQVTSSQPGDSKGLARKNRDGFGK